MNLHDLLQPAFLKPIWRSGAMALLLWALVWWKERPAKGFLPLAVMAAAWSVCHFMVNPHSYQFPPKPEEDWLAIGAAGLLVLGLGAWLCGEELGTRIPVRILGALLIAGAAWFALQQMPYLLNREETPAERNLWTAAGVAGTLLTFAAAEWTARRVSPVALFTGLALFAALAALGMWRVGSPERSVARLLAAASIALAGAIAALLHRGRAAVPSGISGWFSSAVVLLIILGCLSRAAFVPEIPMAAAVVVLPAASLLLALHARLFLSGHGLAFVAVMIFAGTGVFWACDSGARRIDSVSRPAGSTGADDTGAYD